MQYYITDRHAAGGVDAILGHIETAVADGVDYIQIREKDLSARDLIDLTRKAVAIAGGSNTCILVNSRADVAMAAGANGVHLPADSVPADKLRTILPLDFVIACSCHKVEEALRAQREGVDFIVYGPVFQTFGKGPAVGLEALRKVANSVRIPVFALGGVNRENSRLCYAAGAQGFAGISFFQER